MAEEVKDTKETEKADAGKTLKTILKVLLGIVLIAVGALLAWRWRGDLLGLIKGCLGPFLILAGVITLAIAKE